MSKEKQIEEIMEILLFDKCFDIGITECRKMDDCNICKATLLYNAGYRKQSEGEWISVDERLPERSTSVLAYSKKYNEVDVYYYEGANRWWDNDGWASAKYYEITHWMPLPEAPKMKGGAE